MTYVIYHYEMHSSLAIKATISTTSCMGVMVDICSLHLVSSKKKIIFSNSILQLVHHVGNNNDLTVNLLSKSCLSYKCMPIKLTDLFIQLQ